MNRAIRLFLVLLAGLFGGLAIYASTGHFAEPAGEFGATIWIIACFGFAGYLTHRILPAADTADTYAAKRFFTKINEPSLTQNDDDLPVGPWYLSDFDDEERRQPANKVRIAIGTTCPGLRFREEEFPEHTVFFLPPRRGADYQFTLEVRSFPYG